MREVVPATVHICCYVFFLFHCANVNCPMIFNFSIMSTGRGLSSPKAVQMSESEVKGLCVKSREIFLSQPILLELEAPLKICGKCLHSCYVNIYMYLFILCIINIFFTYVHI